MRAEDITLLDTLIEKSEAGDRLTADQQIDLYCLAKRFRKTAKTRLLILEGKRRADNETIRELLVGEGDINDNEVG